jgi:hypothetical protein
MFMTLHTEESIYLHIQKKDGCVGWGSTGGQLHKLVVTIGCHEIQQHRVLHIRENKTLHKIIFYHQLTKNTGDRVNILY